jgi:hypothetical protein
MGLSEEHRLPIVGMQNESTRIDVSVAADVLNQLGGGLSGLALGDGPPHDAPAPHVHDEV